MNTYAKAAVAVLTAALIAVQTALTDGQVTSSEWVTIGLAALGALGVYLIPNASPEPPAPAGKHELREDI